VASTAAADALIAASKRRQLLAFLQALDAFHADEQRIEAGVDPASTQPREKRPTRCAACNTAGVWHQAGYCDSHYMAPAAVRRQLVSVA